MNLKKIQCRWHRFSYTTLPRVDFAVLNQPWADKSTTPMVLVHVHRFPNKQTKPPTRNPPKRNRRGGACVPARTSAQRRFHTGNRFCVSRIVRGEFNDECALAGRRGRAHRHRPYPSPLYIRVQSSPTISTTQTKRVNNLHTTHRGRKCIAHSHPHSLKQVLYANRHRDDALLF